jgi:hypothetical protein
MPDIVPPGKTFARAHIILDYFVHLHGIVSARNEAANSWLCRVARNLLSTTAAAVQPSKSRRLAVTSSRYAHGDVAHLKFRTLTLNC